jgi:hypothetical protein
MNIRTTLLPALVALPVLAGCGSETDEVAPAAAAASATASIDDDVRWVARTESGATITAEAPADDDHPVVEQAEEYREAADAPEVFYVLVVFDNTEGRKTIDVFEGARVVTEEGDELPVPHLAAAGGVFESEINRQLPLTVQDEAYDWYAEFHKRQAVAPGAVEEVVLATTSEISGIAELTVLLDGRGGRATLEPPS